MRLIDVDALVEEMRKAFCVKADGEILVNLDDMLDVIDEMPPIRPPSKLVWGAGIDNDDYHRGYMAGWNMYLTALESQVVKANRAEEEAERVRKHLISLLMMGGA